MPYLLWVSFAAYLNAGIWLLGAVKIYAQIYLQAPAE